MSKSGKLVRRIKVVDGRFQYRMIAVSLSVTLLGLILFGGITALYFAFARVEGRALDPQMLLLVLPPLLLNDLAIMVVAIVIGIFMSHRIAGPVYRISEEINRVLSGERGVRVHLRRKDAFEELAAKVNQLFERIDDERAG